MKMTLLADHFEYYATKLGVRFERNSEVEIKPGLVVRPKFLFCDFGGPCGMLIFTDFAEVRDLADSLDRAGYGVSILGDSVRETSSDEEAFMAMLVDWGWTGHIAEAPFWVR